MRRTKSRSQAKKTPHATPLRSPHTPLTIQERYDEDVRLATLLKEQAERAEAEILSIQPEIEGLSARHPLARQYQAALRKIRAMKGKARWSLQVFQQVRPDPATARLTPVERCLQRGDPDPRWLKRLEESEARSFPAFCKAIRESCKELEQVVADLKAAVSQLGK